MEDAWFSKLLLPTLNELPPTILISILNHWYNDKTVPKQESDSRLILDPLEIDLLTFLKNYGTHVIIAGGSAAVAARQKDHWRDIDVFIPVYGDLDKHLAPCLQHMI